MQPGKLNSPAIMDLLESLLIPKRFKTSQEHKDSLDSTGTMAAAVSLSPLSSQEQTNLQPRAFGPNATELANPLHPPSGQQQSLGSRVHSGLAGPSNLQDIADFDRENPYIPQPKHKLFPIPGNANTGSATKFHNLCQSHGLKPDFTFTEVYPGGYTAKVVFGMEVAETIQPRIGKQPAKDAVCALAIQKLPSVRESTSKRKSFDTDVASDENWIGILQEYSQKPHRDMPLYGESGTTTAPFLFGCTVQVSDGPLTAFGVDLGPFTTKREAKVMAAREAVLWLRGHGKLSEATTKRQKTENISSAASLAGSTGLTQAVGSVNMEAKGSVTSAAQRVHMLANTLGLHQPRYDMQPSQTTSGATIPGVSFCDVVAYFDDRNLKAYPMLAGAIGRVERVFGKQKAKEACCEKVLSVLEEIKRSTNA